MVGCSVYLLHSPVQNSFCSKPSSESLTFSRHRCLEVTALSQPQASVRLLSFEAEKKLQIKFAIEPGHGKLTPGRPVLALTCGRVALKVPGFFVLSHV